jgi:hypothetical protein
MADVQTSEVDSKFEPVSEGPSNIHTDRPSEDKQFLTRPFFGNVEGGWKLIHVLFYGDNSRNVVLEAWYS